MRRVATAFAGLTLIAALVAAQSDPEKVKETVDGTISVQKETQKLKDDWAEEQSQLLTRYRNAQANIRYLSERKAVEADRLAALDDRNTELERRLTESDRLNAVLQDTLMSIYDDLESWVKRDLPFLLDERNHRLAALRTELLRPDVAGAEKLRRVLEALQVEASYGNTVEVGQQGIVVSGVELNVDVLRMGRVSTFWRTPDGKRVGEYDRATGEWVELPSKYRRSIGQAMEMASRTRPIEILSLPLGRIER